MYNYGICEECKQKYTGINWCKSCSANHFQQNFKNWTSNNENIDKFIQDTQLSANSYFAVLEWIPYDRFYDIECDAEGGFGRMYSANWIDGNICGWDNVNKNWTRRDSNMLVALKSLNNSNNLTLEFIDEVLIYYLIKILKYNIFFY
jgi:hypothetical protein